MAKSKQQEMSEQLHYLQEQARLAPTWQTELDILFSLHPDRIVMVTRLLMKMKLGKIAPDLAIGQRDMACCYGHLCNYDRMLLTHLLRFMRMVFANTTTQRTPLEQAEQSVRWGDTPETNPFLAEACQYIIDLLVKVEHPTIGKVESDHAEQ